MKRHLPIFLLTIVCCLIHCLLFGQDSTGKVYSIKFSGYKSRLSKEAVATLNDIAGIMKNQPDCNFKVTSCNGTENEKFNMANWDRVNNTITYLVEKKHIKADRFIFNYGDEGKDCNTIDLAFTEDVLETNPPPPPNLRRKNQ